ncbi:MAG: 7-carboxy-7-deazaguanine synthase QueE [Gammaproteobacteria bacterium]|nr:MAG: 7-carboxy-7-deazaguanine synthase QueE [Gammaproteobacteria bacterium]
MPGEQPARAERLRVTEIFYSLQGESRPAGLPTVFVRLTGCPLRCRWCDTEYAFHGGRSMSMDEIIDAVAAWGSRLVCVTGGEPMAQPNCRTLLQRLCDRGYEVSLETSGALDLAGIDERVTIVMDLKAPGSGEVQRNHWENLAQLKCGDQLKIVIRDREDYDWAVAQLRARDLPDRFAVLLSPAWGELEPRQLAEWILADRLPVRLQLQLHKLLWGEAPGH